MTTFTWWGERVPYFTHPYNDARSNERTIEVACALRWLEGRSGAGLEVGNVLAHYGIAGHLVVDRWEHSPGVSNLDVFDVSGTFDWIVAISTVEHVRWDEQPVDPQGAAAAIEHLRGLLAPGGVMLVTIPCGYHPMLDGAIAAEVTGASRSCTFTRQQDPHRWAQDPSPRVEPYGARTPWAESVWIGEYACTTS